MAVRATQTSHDVTELLVRFRDGDRAAGERLLPLVYSELRRIAAHHLRRERLDHTLQATALVHEAYLRLIEQREGDWKSRSHFFGLAAHLMRLILIDHARKRRAGKRGGRQQKVELDDALVADGQSPDQLLIIDQALKELALFDARAAQVVEMRFFGGLSVDETAEALEVSPTSVQRDWRTARLWLRRWLSAPRTQI